MQHHTSVKNKAGSNVVTTHLVTKMNIPGGLSSAITHLYSTYCINKLAVQSWLWISSEQNWEGNKSNVVCGWLETAVQKWGRSEEWNEHCKAISKDNDMNFGLEKCARICLKKGRAKSKTNTGSTFEKDIRRTGHEEGTLKYRGIEDSQEL